MFKDKQAESSSKLDSLADQVGLAWSIHYSLLFSYFFSSLPLHFSLSPLPPHFSLSRLPSPLASPPPVHPAPFLSHSPSFTRPPYTHSMAHGYGFEHPLFDYLFQRTRDERRVETQHFVTSFNLDKCMSFYRSMYQTYHEIDPKDLSLERFDSTLVPIVYSYCKLNAETILLLFKLIIFLQPLPVDMCVSFTIHISLWCLIPNLQACLYKCLYNKLHASILAVHCQYKASFYLVVCSIYISIAGLQSKLTQHTVSTWLFIYTRSGAIGFQKVLFLAQATSLTCIDCIWDKCKPPSGLIAFCWSVDCIQSYNCLPQICPEFNFYTRMWNIFIDQLKHILNLIT